MRAVTLESERLVVVAVAVLVLVVVVVVEDVVVVVVVVVRDTVKDVCMITAPYACTELPAN